MAVLFYFMNKIQQEKANEKKSINLTFAHLHVYETSKITIPYYKELVPYFFFYLVSKENCNYSKKKRRREGKLRSTYYEKYGISLLN